MSRAIRVLLVDDSLTDLAVLKRMIATSNEIEVVGTAKNGHEALELIPRLDPKVICTDLQMPGLDGLAFTQEVMRRFPRPILVISSLVGSKDSWESFRLIESGAIDVFPKPRDGLKDPQIAKALVDKIRILSGVYVFAKKGPSVSPSLLTPIQKQAGKTSGGLTGVVVVGTSTGGPQALHQVLTGLPKTFPLPILCVQHISEGFVRGLVDWLNKPCQLSVKIMDEGEVAEAGTVYFPKEDTHMMIDRTHRLFSSRAASMGGHRPSVDVLFKSAAKTFGDATIGVLLSGMGRDGVLGLKDIYESGGITLAQDKLTSVVFGMPGAALDLGVVQKMLPLDQIGPQLMETINAQIGINHRGERR